MIPLTLSECAAKCDLVRATVEALRRCATKHGLTIAEHHDTEGLLLAVESLMGQAWAGFHWAANDERAKRGEPMVRPFTEQQAAAAKAALPAAYRYVTKVGGELTAQDREQAEQAEVRS